MVGAVQFVYQLKTKMRRVFTDTGEIIIEI